jgi:AcrR family transcriptional regulator
MHENFEKLSIEKRNKIIEASIKEFAREGYKSASTNNIIKEAEISKGAIFHYFGSKKALYLYILNYLIDYYVKYMISMMKVNNPDILGRILEWEKLKLSIALKEPLVHRFFASAFKNIPDEVKEEVEEIYKRLYKIGYELTTEGIDLSRFRDNLDKQKAIELIIMAMEGILQRRIEKFSFSKYSEDDGITKAFEELEEYITVMRKAFYKDRVEA